MRLRSLAQKEAAAAAVALLANESMSSSLLLCHFPSSLGTCVGKSRNRGQTLSGCPVYYTIQRLQSFDDVFSLDDAGAASEFRRESRESRATCARDRRGAAAASPLVTPRRC